MDLQSGPDLYINQENVRYAGFWVRFLANIIDSLVLGIPVAIAAWILSGFKSTDSTLVQTLYYIITLVIIAYLWTKWGGRTPGKKMMGIKVVSFPGYGPLSYSKSTIRYLIGYTVSTLLLMIGFIMIAFRNDKRGLHDLIAGTCVIYE